MTNYSIFLVILPFPGYRADTGDAQALLPLACVIVTLGALVLAYLGLRRSAVTDERAHTLQLALAAEREARDGSDQALADNHDTLCRLARSHDDVREGERSRIAHELRTELGCRLAALRADLAGLHDNPQLPPTLAGKLERALSNIDGAIGAVGTVAGGLRGIHPGDGLRLALERCLAEHAHLYGLRYRFEAGIDPAARASGDRAARLAVFRVLQDVLAGAARAKAVSRDAELHVRLLEGAATLGLEIDGCAGAADELARLPGELVDHIRAMGGVLRMVATPEQPARWSLSLPVRPAAPLERALAEAG